MGKVVAAKGAMRELDRQNIVAVLDRHEKCYWSKMSPQDVLSN
ncbi:hypothetical protein [Aquibacillus rhizosphaerae]|uniref:Uncharacterized protein n=1 Tax=Aquibacillus rhizosphaerae TaxID=3051431 RepID=A0ABT7L9E2_9BACI|nr:hypothetical protein [Aquibacillus sp. LR5S19]MDL4842489.1 hypothetical protein [Aquibacillus sp. LR5S19]